jgi:hypothetical protein
MGAGCSACRRESARPASAGHASPRMGIPWPCSSESSPAATGTAPLLRPAEAGIEAHTEETDHEAREG